MRPSETESGDSSGAPREAAVWVWIEGGDGSITRGMVQVLSEDGAVVAMSDATTMISGDLVVVRILFKRDAPTLGASASVLWVRPDGLQPECELVWTHAGPDRERLAALVALLS